MRNFILALIVVIAIMIAAAFYLGVVSVSTDRQDGNYVASLTINTASLERATETAEHNVKEKVAGFETVKGRVTEVGSQDQTFTVATSDRREISFQMEPATKVIGSHLKGVRSGDTVAVEYTTRDGQNIVRSITVE